MMTAEQLKNSILQLAVQGKLVPQDPNDEPASVLLKKIAAEKQRLIDEGKIKKQKKLPGITEDEIPFDIPDSWEWVRLKDITFDHGQEKPESNFCYIDIGSIDNKNQQLNSKDNVIKANKAPSRARKIVKNGDILYATVRPYLHNMCIINRTFSYRPIASTGFAVMATFNGIFNKYLFYYLMSSTWDEYANNTENSKGVAYPAINNTRLYRGLVPIPPSKEQHRIVAKIEALMPYVDQYAEVSDKLNQLNASFPSDMRKSILQLAVQGKLVPQDPNDEPASVLLEKIAAEKQRLIDEGKIKKQKKLPEITEDEKPFDIPDSWEWCHLAMLGITQTGNTPSKTHSEYFGSDIPFITPGDIFNGIISYNNRSLSNIGKNVARVCNKESILQVCIGGSIGKAAITNREVAFNQQINVISPLICNNKYIYFVMQSSYFILSIKNKAGGTATPIINRGIWDLLLIPLPPLAEQERIVKKLDEVLPLCDQLERLGE